MKMIKFLSVPFIVLLASFVFVSCDKEENIDSASLVGDWILIHQEGYEEYNGKREDLEKDYPTDEYLNYQLVVKFMEKDGGLYMMFTDYEGLQEGDIWDDYLKVQVDESEIVPVLDDEDFTEEEMTFKIIELTSTKMVLYNREKDIDSSYESTMTFKKLN